MRGSFEIDLSHSPCTNLFGDAVVGERLMGATFTFVDLSAPIKCGSVYVAPIYRPEYLTSLLLRNVAGGSYSTVADHAEVSPDSKPSAKRSPKPI